MSQGLSLPTTGYLRLPQVLALFPVSRSAFYLGIKEGRYPAPVKLGKRTSAWRVEDIATLINRFNTAHAEGGLAYAVVLHAAA